MNIFSYVKQKLSIEEVVGPYTQLKRAGGYLKGSCPLHMERTASFTVTPSRNCFYCFGCHQGGDIIEFIVRVEHCNNKEAVEHLIRQHRLIVPEELIGKEPEFKARALKERERHELACTIFTEWCIKQAETEPAVADYFKKRGIKKETASEFQLGYFPHESRLVGNLIHYAQTHKVLVNDLISAHILQQNSSGYYSPFQNRIIFPIKDHLGRICAFGGRTFREFDERPKYYNSKENNFFSKGELVYNLFHAKKEIQKTSVAFLVEGYIDCILLSQSGIRNSIATLGTACSLEQLQQIAQHAQKLFVVYDADSAGIAALMKLTKFCWKTSLELRVIQLPDGQDPASFTQKHGSIKPLIEHSYSIISFFVTKKTASFLELSLQEKLEVVQELTDIVAEIEDPMKGTLLLQHIAQQTDIPLNALKRHIQKAVPLKQQQPGKALADQKETEFLNKKNSLEEQIFSVIINKIEYCENKSVARIVEYLPEPFKQIVNQAYMMYTQGVPQEEIWNNLKYESSPLLEKIMHTAEMSNDEQFTLLVRTWYKRYWKIIMRDVQKNLKIAQQQADSNEVGRILRRLSELRQELMTQGVL